MQPPKVPAPERLTLAQVAKAIGVCKGRVLREYIRLGHLPYPGPDQRWARADVDRVLAWHAERARGTGLKG